MADEDKKKEPVPTWAYKDGEARLFADVADVPKGWSDTPAAPEKKPAPKKDEAD